MSVRAFSSYVIAPSELASALNSPPAGSRIVTVSGDWYLPNDGRNGHAEYLKRRIPGARFFDQDKVKDLHSPYPHMLPTGETFAAAMSELGIQRDDTVVVYDSPHLGIFAGPRVAWIFRVFGHPKVHLLNNFKLWVEHGLPTEAGPAAACEKTQNPVVQPRSDMAVSFEEMARLSKEGTKEGVEIVDARPNARFWGEAPEPRPGACLPGGECRRFG